MNVASKWYWPRVMCARCRCKSRTDACLTQCRIFTDHSDVGPDMDATAICDTVKQSIARITGIPPDQIGDTASYTADLGLDSLSLLEIAVDAEMCFHVKIPDERLSEIRTVSDTVRVVSEYLSVAARA